jgi:hypothetical protein
MKHLVRGLRKLHSYNISLTISLNHHFTYALSW